MHGVFLMALQQGIPYLVVLEVCYFYQMFTFFSFKAGLGLGTNNFAELCALKLLLILARRNLLDKIQFFSDSQLVINWASGKYRLLNLELAMIL